MFDYTIEKADQAEAVANIKEASARVEIENELFKQKLRNSDSQLNWITAVPRSKIHQVLGAYPPPEQNVFYELPDVTFDGYTVDLQSKRRRKRATVSSLPECQNLPSYKNYAEEGKTAPVQNQKRCGKV
jgi:hypothetical protein